MLLLTVSFSRAESPWPNTGASSYSCTHDKSSVFKSVVLVNALVGDWLLEDTG